MVRIGSMFSGYGGLDTAVAAVTGGSTAWVADICGDGKHKKVCGSPCVVLAERFPDAPNLGDVTLIDFEKVEQVDVLAAGFPCQDLSVAGKRRGLTGGRSGLWSEVVRGIETMQPRMVVLENVSGIYTAHATGSVEPCSWCLGDTAAIDMRALDAVLSELAEIGYDAEWSSFYASDVGAPHRRERWFCIAWPSGRPPTFANSNGVESVGFVPELQRFAARSDMQEVLQVEELLHNLDFTSEVVFDDNNRYTPSIRRWEKVTGFKVPAVTEPHPNKPGKQRLTAEFYEWMMGLPKGWVTSVPNVSYDYQMKIFGNGVVPQQAASAIQLLLARAHQEVTVTANFATT